MFTEDFQFLSDVVNLYFHVLLFDLETSDLFLNPAGSLLALLESEDEVLGGLDDLPAHVARVEAGGADESLLVRLEDQHLVREVGVEQEDAPADSQRPEDVPTLEDGADLPPEATGGEQSGQPALASEEVCGVSQQGGLHLGDHLHPAHVGVDLRLLPDQPGVADGQTVEEVHQDHDYQEHKQEEEAITEGRVEGNVTELQLPSKHCECLDQCESEMIKKWKLFVSLSIILMEKDVERTGKREDEH